MMGRMAARRDLAWPAAGVVAGGAGLLTSYATAMVLTVREAPVAAIAELVVRLTPGGVAEKAIRLLGFWDKPFLLAVVLLLSAALFWGVGAWARRRWWLPVLVLSLMAVVGAVAVLFQREASTVDLVPVVVGYATWLVALSALTEPLRRAGERPAPADPQRDAAADAAAYEAEVVWDGGRRQFLVRALTVAAVSAVAGVAGRVLGSGRREVEETRRLLRLDLREPRVPAGVRVDVEGVTPWQTPNEDFYRIDTAIVTPAIAPTDWTLRIHGMVERELVLTYDDLVARELTDAWVTLNCVSNEVGGDLIGNAWWSGVRLQDLLAEAGPLPGADAVLQTSDDGWTCGTPLAAMTDGRDAMLAVAMNGTPLPIDHGFPVRTIVPGLYGYVSATKWVVDMEVTRFDEIAAYWTQRGWGELGPVKMASRVDVPRSGETVPAGPVRVGGVAWAQGTGISAVEVSLDGGAWQRMELGRVPSEDTWVQWGGTVEVGEGDHLLRVRAVDAEGQVQTAVERDVLPDGATGHDSVDFSAEA